MLDLMYFIPEKSDFILDANDREDAVAKVKRDFIGNVWEVFKDKKALGGAALGAPGDNNFDSNFPLVCKLPVPVKAGEAGGWRMWARLNRIDDPNSFYWMVSPDAENWTPKALNVDTHGWNNPAGPLMTKKPPWFWFAGNGSPALAEGDNYVMLAARESDIQNMPLIDVLSIRNDGKSPTDEEAEKLLAEQYKGLKSPLGAAALGEVEEIEEEEEKAVSPGGKLATMWGGMKKERNQ